MNLACFQNPNTDEMSLKIGKSKKANSITLRLVTGSGFKLAKQDYNIFLETLRPCWGFGSKANSPLVLVDPQNDPFYTPKHYVFQGEMSNLDAKNTFFRTKIGNVPLQTWCFLECGEGHFEGVEKDKW